MNGVISILKPPGMTSHDVVSHMRKVTGIKKIGHTGTLDPGAAGVLPLCIGKATKIVDYIMNDRKTYICELTLGNTTNTYDKYGVFNNTEDRSDIILDRDLFFRVLEGYKGEIEQIPPAFSAIRINGVRSYELAREGMQVKIPPRKVVIYDIRVLKFDRNKVLLRIECSKGTYIRSICNDIGDALGYGGYMSFLIRTSTGNFNLKNSCTMDEISKDNVQSFIQKIDFALNMDSIYVDDLYENKLLNGNPIQLSLPRKSSQENCKIYINPDKFIGIGRIEKKTLVVEKLMI